MSAILIHCLLSALLIGAKELPNGLDHPDIGSENGTLQIIFSTECFRSYFVYQSLALKHSFDKVGQTGSLTRIISCDDEHKISQEDMETVDTLVVPSWKIHPVTGDAYAPYNKPSGIMYWLSWRRPKAEWTLMLDPDMILRRSLSIEDLWVPEGFARSHYYNYLSGATNEVFSSSHIPDMKTMEDQYGGPPGRFADLAGFFVFIRTKDLAKLAPLWMKFTEDVREDPLAWKFSGDQHVQEGKKPWIAEMYGYIFGAAAAGLRSKVDASLQYYPNYRVFDIPCIIHYGLVNQAGEYSFSKHKHFDFEPLRCPPWSTKPDREEKMDYGLLPHPPRPSQIERTKDPQEDYGTLLAIEAVNTINKALCKRHRQKCVNRLQIHVELECRIVDHIEMELEEEYEYLDQSGVVCRDMNESCKIWKETGHCETTWLYMHTSCRASCGLCRTMVKTEEPLNLVRIDGQSEQITNEESTGGRPERYVGLSMSTGAMLVAMVAIWGIVVIMWSCRRRRCKSKLRQAML